MPVYRWPARRFLPDRMLREQDMPRTVSLVVLALLALAACFLNAFAHVEWFATAAGVTGFAFGGIQGIVPALASEIFGLRYLATNYSMLQMGPALCKPLLVHLPFIYKMTPGQHLRPQCCSHPNDHLPMPQTAMLLKLGMFALKEGRCTAVPVQWQMMPMCLVCR